MSEITTTKCPICGNSEAYKEEWHDSGELYIFCEFCGYRYDCYYNEDEDELQIDEDLPGCGLIHVNRTHINTQYPIYTQKGLNNHITIIHKETNDVDNDIKCAYTTMWDGNKIVKKIIYENDKVSVT